MSYSLYHLLNNSTSPSYLQNIELFINSFQNLIKHLDEVSWASKNICKTQKINNLKKAVNYVIVKAIPPSKLDSSSEKLAETPKNEPIEKLYDDGDDPPRFTGNIFRRCMSNTLFCESSSQKTFTQTTNETSTFTSVFSQLFPAPSKTIQQSLLKQLLTFEAEHFRYATFEASMRSAVDDFKTAVNEEGGDRVGVMDFTFKLSYHIIIFERNLDWFRSHVDDLQREEVSLLFKGAFEGLKLTTSSSESGKAVEYLICLSALLTACPKLRKPAGEALASLFSLNANKLVELVGKLLLLDEQLLYFLETLLSDDQNGSQLLQPEEFSAYKNFLYASLCLLQKLFSPKNLQHESLAGLGEKVDVEGFTCLLTFFLPFWTLQLTPCKPYNTFYLHVEAFANWCFYFASSEPITLDKTGHRTHLNFTALLAALLRLLNRLTAEPMKVLAKMMGTSSEEDENVNFQTRNIVAKTLLNNIWCKVGRLFDKMEGVTITGSCPLRPLLIKTENKTALEELLLQLYFLFERYSDPPLTKHLNAELVKLGNETSERLLRYLVNANLGSNIWNYFGKVDEAIAKSAQASSSKSGLFLGTGRDQYVVMITYLSSLGLDRPCQKESYCIEGDDAHYDDDDSEMSSCGSDEDAKKDDNADKFYDVNENVIEIDSNQSKVNESLKCGQTEAVSSLSTTSTKSDQLSVVIEPPKPTSTEKTSNSTTNFKTSSTAPSIEKSLSTFSQSVVGLSAQMLTSAETLINDLAQIQNLKLESESPAILFDETNEPVAPKSDLSSSFSSSSSCSSTSFSIVVEDFGQFSISSSTSGDDNNLKKEDNVFVHVDQSDCHSNDHENNIAENSASVLIELKKMQKKMAEYEKTIAQIIKKIDSFE